MSRVPLKDIPTPEEAAKTMLTLILKTRNGELSADNFLDVLFKMPLPVAGHYFNRSRRWSRGIGNISDTVLQKIWAEGGYYYSDDLPYTSDGAYLGTLRYKPEELTKALSYLNTSYSDICTWTTKELLSLYVLTQISSSTPSIVDRNNNFLSLENPIVKGKSKAIEFYPHILGGILNLFASKDFKPTRNAFVYYTFHQSGDTIQKGLTSLIEDITEALIGSYLEPIFTYSRYTYLDYLYNTKNLYSLSFAEVEDKVGLVANGPDLEDMIHIEKHYPTACKLLFNDGLLTSIMKSSYNKKYLVVDYHSRSADTFAMMLLQNREYIEPFVKSVFREGVSVKFEIINNFLSRYEFRGCLDTDKMISWIYSEGINVDSVYFLRRLLLCLPVFDDFKKLDQFRVSFDFQTGKVSDLVSAALQEWDNRIHNIEYLDQQCKKYIETESIGCGAFASYPFVASRAFFILTKWMIDFFGVVEQANAEQRRIDNYTNGIRTAYKALDFSGVLTLPDFPAPKFDDFVI